VNKNLRITFWFVVLMAVSWTAVSSYAPISNIADGTVNTILAAVKAASTAATSSDPALVVTESPNSPLVTGNLKVVNANPSTFYAGQQTLTTSAAQWNPSTFPSTTVLVNSIVLTAPTTNTGKVCIGPTSSVTSTTGYCLPPGASTGYSITGAFTAYIIDTNATDVLMGTGN